MNDIIILDETNGKSEMGRLLKLLAKINNVKYYTSIGDWIEEEKQDE